jgi:hypothetical protein
LSVTEPLSATIQQDALLDRIVEAGCDRAAADVELAARAARLPAAEANGVVRLDAFGAEIALLVAMKKPLSSQNW